MSIIHLLEYHFKERLEKFRARFKKEKTQEKTQLRYQKQRLWQQFSVLSRRNKPQKAAVEAANNHLCH